MSPTQIVLVVVGGIVLLALIWLIATYNSFVRLRQHISESWADIDVELKRRYELIPNLVATVKGYAAHERQTFEAIVSARNAAMQGSHVPGAAAQQALAETQLQSAIGRMFALAEAYPTLKADQNFRALQTELANTEDRLAAARRFFNGNVRDFNQLCATFPSSLVAGWFKFEPRGFFELSSDAERVVPRVEV